MDDGALMLKVMALVQLALSRMSPAEILAIRGRGVRGIAATLIHKERGLLAYIPENEPMENFLELRTEAIRLAFNLPKGSW